MCDDVWFLLLCTLHGYRDNQHELKLRILEVQTENILCIFNQSSNIYLINNWAEYRFTVSVSKSILIFVNCSNACASSFFRISRTDMHHRPNIFLSELHSQNRIQLRKTRVWGGTPQSQLSQASFWSKDSNHNIVSLGGISKLSSIYISIQNQKVCMLFNTLYVSYTSYYALRPFRHNRFWIDFREPSTLPSKYVFNVHRIYISQHPEVASKLMTKDLNHGFVCHEGCRKWKFSSNSSTFKCCIAKAI